MDWDNLRRQLEDMCLGGDEPGLSSYIPMSDEEIEEWERAFKELKRKYKARRRAITDLHKSVNQSTQSPSKADGSADDLGD
jgi:DNA/RNA-binding domain of Phe-tRNA-synthetase-like protein